MRKKSITIYQLKNVSIDDIVNHHKTEYEYWKSHPISDDADKAYYDILHGIDNVVDITKGKEITLYYKYTHLIHAIIKGCISKKQGAVYLNSQILNKLYGPHYGDLIENLKMMQILRIYNGYTVGKASYSYYIDNKYNEIIKVESCNNKVIKYEQKLKEILKENEKEIKKILNENTTLEQKKENDILFNNYNKSLSKVKLIKIEEAYNYLKNKKYESKNSEYYYYNKIDNSINFKITSIDRNKRIYHYFTNLPSELKQYFNFKFQADIHNSHPLLFSYYLIEYYNIPNNIISILCNLDININYNNNHILNVYNVFSNLHNTLINNNIGYKLNDIPDDVIYYIYCCSKGIFWDDFLDYYTNNIDENKSRKEIKTALFGGAFYSHKLNIRKDKDIYADTFRKIYPHVWKVIKAKKKERELENDSLANILMAKESELFQAILKECYKRKWSVISIHDAILVIDIEDNKNVSPEAVTEVIKDIYAQASLYPTVGIDFY